MHTILGAGGPVANALSAELIANQQTVRLISRKPITTGNSKVSWRKADLLDYAEVLEAAKGATVIYLCAGLIYDAQIWAAQWPVIMQNVIRLTKETGARLIFFDNVYMYGLVDGPMTEATPYRASSRKGKIRAAIADMLMDEVKAGHIRASIARAPDFYGTNSMNSFFDMMILDKFAANSMASWIGNPKVLHNFIYIPDAGKALYLLGQDRESDNQVWHLPTAAAITGKEFIDLAAKIYGVKPRYMVINKLMLQLFGLFKKVVAGTVEMYYQYDHDYIFDSSKFEKAFSFTPTSYAAGIKQQLSTNYKKR
jgi:nucleoside-diphosphate-sugar epimerase